jgi:hypothetical protein
VPSALLLALPTPRFPQPAESRSTRDGHVGGGAFPSASLDAAYAWRREVHVFVISRAAVLAVIRPRRWNPEGWLRLGALLALVSLRPKAGIFPFFAVGRLGWIRAGGASCATVVDERCQGGNDSRASTADEFPCPRDPDDQR